MKLKIYVNKKDIRYSESSETSDLVVKEFMKSGIVSVNVDRFYTEAVNVNGDTLRWWSENKYYGYGSDLALNGQSATKDGAKPGLYYRNVLANIEHGDLTIDPIKSPGYICSYHKSDIYLMDGNFVCKRCGFNKPKNILNLERKEFMK